MLKRMLAVGTVGLLGAAAAGLSWNYDLVQSAFAGAPDHHNVTVSEPHARDSHVPTGTITQDYTPNPAIWLLSDNDTQIYLFGTYHVLPPGLKWRTAQFDAIVQKADALVVESSDADFDAIPDEVFAKMFGDLSRRTPTSEKLSAESGAKWLSLAETMGLPPEVFDLTPPMLALISLGIGFNMEAGSTSEAGVETVLEAEFARAGKPILSIEDPAEVLGNVLGIDENLLIAQLERDLQAWDGKNLNGFMVPDGEVGPSDPFVTEHQWARGEVLVHDVFGHTAFEQEMRQVLLADRNKAWAQWLDNRLDSPGTILVAVGAGHFEGQVSVQAFLADRGLQARRIN